MSTHPPRPATIGASEAAIALGLQRTAADGTPYTSALELWARLRGLVPRYGKVGSRPSPAAEVGHWVEVGALAAWVERRRPLGPVFPGPALTDPPWWTSTLPHVHARPDAFGAGRTVEAKAPLRFDPERWGPDGTDEVPAEYYAQVLVQTAVAHAVYGWSDAELVALARDPDNRAPDAVRVYLFKREPLREARVIDALARWWELHIERGRPPEPDASESAAATVAAIFGASAVAGTAIEAEPLDIEQAHRLLSIRSLQQELALERRELETRLKSRLGTATELRHGKRLIATWRETKRGGRQFRLRGGGV